MFSVAYLVDERWVVLDWKPMCTADVAGVILGLGPAARRVINIGWGSGWWRGSTTHRTSNTRGVSGRSGNAPATRACALLDKPPLAAAAAPAECATNERSCSISPQSLVGP